MRAGAILLIIDVAAAAATHDVMLGGNDGIISNRKLDRLLSTTRCDR